MNSKAKGYKPFDKGLQQTLINAKAIASAGRTERYVFKSKSGLPGGGIEALLASELKSLAASKYELLEQPSSQWDDRMYGSLAAPLGAEMFLNSECYPSTMLGAPRFYHSELSAPLSDDHGRSMPPSVLPRFPYSTEAHEAAKKLQSKLARNLLRRNYAASVIQRCYINYINIKRFRIECIAKHVAICKIQWFCRKRLERTRQRQHLKRHRHQCCIMIQTRIRQCVAVMRVSRYRAKRIYKFARVIQRFIAWCPRELRCKRGRRRRLDIHATRLQSAARGRQCRQRLRQNFPFWKITTSQYFINKMLRVPVPHYERVDGKTKIRLDDDISVGSLQSAASARSNGASIKSGGSGVQSGARSGALRPPVEIQYQVTSFYRLTNRALQSYFSYLIDKEVVNLPEEALWTARCSIYGSKIRRLLRINVLMRKIARIHCAARMYLARRKLRKVILKMLSDGKSRSTGEQLLIERALVRATSELVSVNDPEWCLGIGTSIASRASSKGAVASAPIPGSVISMLSPSEELAATLMTALQIQASKITSQTGDVRVSALDPFLNLGSMTSKQRLALGIISIFANRPAGNIDKYAISALRLVLRPNAMCISLASSTSKISAPNSKQKRTQTADTVTGASTRVSVDLTISGTDSRRTNPVVDGRDGFRVLGVRGLEGSTDSAHTSISNTDTPYTGTRHTGTISSSTHDERPHSLSSIQPLPVKNSIKSQPSIPTLPSVTARSTKSSGRKIGSLLAVANDDEELAWQWLESHCLMNILALSHLLEPSTSMSIRIAVRGAISDKILAMAVLVRRWSEWTDDIVKRAIWKHRRFNKPKFSCPHCLEAFSLPGEEKVHLRFPSSGGHFSGTPDHVHGTEHGDKYGKKHMVCVRGGCFTWVRTQAYVAPLELLHRRLLRLGTGTGKYFIPKTRPTLLSIAYPKEVRDQYKSITDETMIILRRRQNVAHVELEARIISGTVSGTCPVFLSLLERKHTCPADDLDAMKESDDEAEIVRRYSPSAGDTDFGKKPSDKSRPPPNRSSSSSSSNHLTDFSVPFKMSKTDPIAAARPRRKAPSSDPSPAPQKK